MSTAVTFYFNDIFPTFTDWENWTLANNLVSIQAEEMAFNEFVYNILMRHYSHSNIRYSDKQSFKSELAIVFQNKFKQFLEEKRIIDNMYQLTLDELQIVNTTISNMANNPNNAVEDPTQPLNYISAQTYQQLRSNKLKAYLDALNNIPSLNIYEFLKPKNKTEMGFDDLFMVVQPNNDFYYKKEYNL